MRWIRWRRDCGQCWLRGSKKGRVGILRDALAHWHAHAEEARPSVGLWGPDRIRDALLLLGYDAPDSRTIRKYMVKPRKPRYMFRDNDRIFGYGAGAFLERCEVVISP